MRRKPSRILSICTALAEMVAPAAALGCGGCTADPLAACGAVQLLPCASLLLLLVAASEQLTVPRM